MKMTASHSFLVRRENRDLSFMGETSGHKLVLGDGLFPGFPTMCLAVKTGPTNENMICKRAIYCWKRDIW